MVDVSQLVSQMHETLSSIHSTISSLSVLDHETQLDGLEQGRDAAVAALRSGFALESDDLARKRQAQLAAIAEQRRREDEERKARRRKEDEALLAQVAEEDKSRQVKLDQDTREVEESTESMMGNVEEEAKRMLDEGKAKLAALEDRRKELNRLIDEQLRLPLPTAPTRRKPREQPLPEIAASNPVDTLDKRDEHGDGDRDALSAAATHTTEVPAELEPEIAPTTSAVEVSQEEVVIDGNASAEKLSEETNSPLKDSAVLPVSDNRAEESPFHDNLKYIREDSSHIVPGGFPMSALHSPISENMNVGTSSEISELQQQSLATVISRQPEALSHPDNDDDQVEIQNEEYQQDPEPAEFHEQPPEPQLELQHEKLPTENDHEPVHSENELVVSTDPTEEDKHDAAIPSSKIESPVLEAYAVEEDQATLLKEESIHEGEEGNLVEKKSDMHEKEGNVHGDTGHEEAAHEEPAHEEDHSEPTSPVTAVGIPNITIDPPVTSAEYSLRSSYEESQLPPDEPTHSEGDEHETHETNVALEEQHRPGLGSEHEAATSDSTVQELDHELQHTPAATEIPVLGSEEATHAITPAANEDMEPGVQPDEHHDIQYTEAEEHGLTVVSTNDQSMKDSPEEHYSGENVDLEQNRDDSTSPPDEQEHSSPDSLHENVPEHDPSSVSAPATAHVEDEGQSHGGEAIQDAKQPQEEIHPGEAVHLQEEGHVEDIHPQEAAHPQEEMEHSSPNVVPEETVQNEPLLEEAQIPEDAMPHKEATSGIMQHDPTSSQIAAETQHLSPESLTTVDVVVEDEHYDQPHDSRENQEGLEYGLQQEAEIASNVEANQHEDIHEDSITDHEDVGLVHQPNTAGEHQPATWNYQEPYVAQEAYAYAAPEYVDYGSSYYASAQQSLDPSPVFHEAFDVPLQLHNDPSLQHFDGHEEPTLHDNVIFSRDEVAPPEAALVHETEHNGLSLDKELDYAEREEEESETGSFDDDLHPEPNEAPVLRAENAATVHGQDDLFDNDSEGSADSGRSLEPETIEHELIEHEVMELREETPQDIHSHNTDIHAQGHEDLAAADGVQEHEVAVYDISHGTHDEFPETPTTVVGDAHFADEEETQPEAEPPVQEFGTVTVLSDEKYVAEVPHYEEAMEEHARAERPVTPAASFPAASQIKGLASSRHAPKENEPIRQQQQQTPVTPPRQTAGHAALQEQVTPSSYDGPHNGDDDLDVDDFMPRDVRDVPWHERSHVDATPGSVRSQTTMSASSLSDSPTPWAATTPKNGSSGSNNILYDPRQDEPFIRNSWSSTPDDYSSRDGGLLLDRSKPIGQLDYDGHVMAVEEKRLALDTVQPVAGWAAAGERQKERPQHQPSSRPSSIVAPSPSSLFQRMRSIFEPPNGGSATDADGHGSPRLGSPAKTLTASPASGSRDPYPATSSTPNRLVNEGFIRGVQRGEEHSSRDDDDEDGGITERSSLLQAAAVGMPSPSY